MTRKVFSAALHLGLWGAVGVVILWFTIFLPISAQEAPQFIVGQRYLVVWSCWPEWAPQVVSPQPLNPCYVETLEVRTVYKNGWLTVRDEDGTMWNVNPEQSIGYRAESPPQQVTR